MDLIVEPDSSVWSSFEDENNKDYVPHQSIQEPTEGTSDLQSPADTPASSQGPHDSLIAPPSVSSTPTPPTTRSSSQLRTSDSNMETSPDDAVAAKSNVFVSRILTNDLLYDLTLCFTDPCTLMRTARTCRLAHSAVQSHITRYFNINNHLLAFFTDPLAFRSLQAKTGTLISGSNVLQFLDRTYYPEADLDLYCFYDARAEVGLWLIEEGYRFAPNSRQDPSFHIAVDQARVPGTADMNNPYSRMKGVSAVYTFIKRIENQDGPNRRLKVQIIVAYNSPMEAIFHFHSSKHRSSSAFNHLLSNP